MKVKPGYKQTEVGVIPEDWKLPTLNTLVDSSRGIRYGIVQPGKYDPKGCFMVRGQDYSKGWVDPSELFRVSARVEEPFANARIRTGDILVTIVGASTGRVAIVPEWLDGANLTQTTARIAINEAKANNAYCGHVLASWYGMRQVQNYIKGGAQPGLNCGDIEKFLLPLPPTKAEQGAIAEALSDADALIESLGQLLVKKRQLKQGAMQELLTGKKRLSGFSGDWSTHQLGEVIDSCSSGATPYRGHPEYYKGTIKWITSGELNYNLITDTIEHISEEAVEKTNLKVHPAGTFLMAITGLEAAGTRGACGIVGSPATTNQSCMAIYPTSKLKTEFLFHYYILRGNELALTYCQGTKQQSYTAKLVRLLPIDLPPTVEEQVAIAEVLTDLDAEIAALEAKLTKARSIKQGMMQELLTGRIRLV